MADKKSEDLEYRCGFVALLGRPNVGKSSLINTLLKEKVAAVSSKPQTTRNAIRCILTTEKEQIIFVDTPGIHKPKNVLGDYMVNEAGKALAQVDLICFVVEAGDSRIGEEEELIIEILSKCGLPIVLAVNKVDKLSDPGFFWKTVEMYETRIMPAAVVPISAKKRDEHGCFYRYTERDASSTASYISCRHAHGYDRTLPCRRGDKRKDPYIHGSGGAARNGGSR